MLTESPEPYYFILILFLVKFFCENGRQIELQFFMGLKCFLVPPQARLILHTLQQKVILRWRAA